MVKSPTIDGYTASDKELSGTLSENTSITVSYSPVTYSLAIDYRYDVGGSVATSFYAEQPYQNDYSVTSPVVEGYTADQLIVSGTISENTNITVTYTGNAYTVAFDATDATGTMSSVGMVYGTASTLPVCTLEKDGYTFVGWDTDASADEVIYVDGGKVSFTTDAAKNCETITLYPVWVTDATTYTVEHYLADALEDSATISVASGTEVVVANYANTYEGYVYDAEKSNVTGTTIAIYYEYATYQLTWNFAGGSTTETAYTQGTVAYLQTIVAPESVTKIGYRFNGWGSNLVTNMPAMDMTFVALWVKTYDITYMSDTTVLKTDTVDAYGTVTTYTPVQSKYSFEGWYEDAELQIEFDATQKIDEDMTLYAKWRYTGSTSSSGSFTPTTTTTSSVDDGVITPTISTSSGVTSATVTESAMESAIDSADGDTVEIAVNTKSTTDTVSLTLSGDALETFANSGVDTLEISSSLGYVTFSSEAAQSIASQANGYDITIVVEAIDLAAELSAAQQAQIGDGTIVDVSILCDGVPITSFDGADIIVAIPYTLKTGEVADNVAVWYIADDGTITIMDSAYDTTDELAIFSTNHLSIYAVVYNNSLFTDVSAEAYYYDAVLWAVANGITTGYADGTFRPTDACTRAQAVTFLWRAAGEPEATIDNPFSDLDETAYYYDAVLWAVENGVTTGYEDGTFRPDTTCNRGAIVTFLYRLAGEPEVTGETLSDVAVGTYYYDAVLWAVENGITTGYVDGTFQPTTTCNRGAIVTFLYRYLA
ncbi:S-layer homology domain-containing protein [Bengtsoniella intestinalis]